MVRVRFNRRIVLVFLCLVLVAFAGVAWFFNNYEQEEYEVRTNMTPAARYNQLLAANLFLQEIGIEAESYRGRDLLTSLPDAGDVLFLYRQSGALTPTQLDNLYTWIENGGHLIVAPKYVLDSDDVLADDDLLFRLGVSKRRAESSACGCGAEQEEDDESGLDQEAEDGVGVEDESGVEPEEDEEDEGDGELVEVDFGGRTLDFRFDDYHYLVSGEQEPVFRVPSAQNEGDYLLQYQAGRGKLTIVTNTYVFSNYNIEEGNFAYLLAWLVKDNRKVWLLYSSKVESIYVMLYRAVPFFLLSLLFLIIFFIWYKQNRIGPLHKPERDERRNVLAHIDGTGKFHWRLDKGNSLLARIREPLFAYWSRQAGGGNNKSKPDWDRIAELAGIGRQEVKAAFADKIGSEHDLVRICRLLQKLGNTGSKNYR